MTGSSRCGTFGLRSRTCKTSGLDKDRQNVYLNYQGWDIRNISGLELLDTLRRQLDLE